MILFNQLKFTAQTVALSLILLTGRELLSGDNYSLAQEVLSPLAMEITVALPEEISDRDIESIENLVLENIQGYNQEDLQGVMDSVHPDSPAWLETQQLTEYSFLMYDLDYETNALEIIEVSESEAVIRITLTAIKITGPEFQNNRSTSVQTLRKHNGQWKFFDLLEIEEIEYLN